VQTAQLQEQIALNAARLAELPVRERAWQATHPFQIELPVWYFAEDEVMAAGEAEVEAAQEALAAAREQLRDMIEAGQYEALQAAETRLAQAQEALQVADLVLERAKRNVDEELEEAAQEAFDAAEDELEAAQDEYDRLIDEAGDPELIEARARLAVAQEHYDAALDRQLARLTGEEALQVQAAALALKTAEAVRAQAQTGVEGAERGLEGARARLAQAEKTVAQAQAELNLLDLQLEKLAVVAPAAGKVITKLVEAGEVVQPGTPVLTLGNLEGLTITVYLPEDLYGQVQVGAPAEVKVDSFPGERFEARVSRIAERAEYTPRNVQTQEGRRATVFAVELSVIDPEGRLKPGMPADVTFSD
jgi:HlyD family secretion protein